MGFERLARDFGERFRRDPFTRGRYATDASIYQVMPAAVALPRDADEIRTALDAASEEGLPVTGRGGGTSQCGQTVNHGLILDNSRHMNRILHVDAENRRALVEPGVVLDELNRVLKPHGLWFPVDVSTASRATIGGMAANNSCGGKSLRYGPMRDNVTAIDAVLADGTSARFGIGTPGTNGPLGAIAADLLRLGHDNAALIEDRTPKLNRRVGGYNIDAITAPAHEANLAHLLVGSEGTLAYFTAIELKLWPLVGEKVLAACHFPSFRQAMEASQHVVALGPLSVELVDDTMIGLSRQIPMFRQVIEGFVRGEPVALLLVEFDEGSQPANAAKLRDLKACMGDLGLSWDGEGRRHGGSVEITDARQQAQIAEVRKSGLNIMMSMREEGKPVSFVEDCAIPLPDLADYTERLTEVFARHGTKGTWYAHASEGCLHVRPVLNLKTAEDTAKMRAIAEAAFDLVAEYGGSHSGEHGDGIVRSEFHEKMYGREITDLFGAVKRRLDPENRLNPGRIVDPPRMDDRTLFRFKPDYAVAPIKTRFDWSAWPGGAGGFGGAVEMCNNNGACRKLAGGTMCPSYRVTREERDSTRGRANSLRLALSGQLGDGALTSDAMAETMSLCVSCKACRRECPTGVDMARMKTEVLAARMAERGLSLRDRLVGHMPRYAPWAARAPWLMNLRNRVPLLARLLERPTGMTASRSLPHWSGDPFRDREADDPAPDVLLFADAFNRWFEPGNLRAGLRVLRAGGLRVATARDGAGRPLDCGRTRLAVGDVDGARAEARRLIAATRDHVARGGAVVGLEPSSLLTLRDEVPALLPGPEADALAERAVLLEELIIRRDLALPLRPIARPMLLHGHCHQKAHGVMGDVEAALRRIPDADLAVIESSCCGMAGAFGYGTETHAVSLRMAEAALLPAVRAAPVDALVVADGTSCRHQIADGAGRRAYHVAAILDMALANAEEAQ